MELELQMTVSHHVGVRNQNWVLVGAISILNHRVISPVPDFPCREKNNSIKKVWQFKQNVVNSTLYLKVVQSTVTISQDCVFAILWKKTMISLPTNTGASSVISQEGVGVACDW